MLKNPVITIARQYGSGGSDVGKKVAELLGIKAYDKELIAMFFGKIVDHANSLKVAMPDFLIPGETPSSSAPDNRGH